MNRLVLLIAALIVSAQALAYFPDAKRVRFVDRVDFIGLRFRVDGSRCSAGLFGRDVDLAGIACEGDPWADR